MNELTRRDFMSTSLKGGVLITIASAVDLKVDLETHVAEAAQVVHAAEEAGPVAGSFKYFNADQAAMVKAAASTILPSDEAPGANEVNAVGFIDEAVSKSDALKNLFTVGLQGINETSQVSFGKNFVDLTPEQQEFVLRLMQAGVAPGLAWNLVSSAELFNTLRSNTLFAFYTNPRVYPSLKWPGPEVSLGGWPDWAGPER